MCGKRVAQALGVDMPVGDLMLARGKDLLQGSDFTVAGGHHLPQVIPLAAAVGKLAVACRDDAAQV